MDELKTVRVKRNINFDDIESIASTISKSANTRLAIPNNFSSSGGFGIEAAATQLLSAWLRSSKTHSLYTPARDSSPESFHDLCNSLFGLCALRLADNILLSNNHEVALAQALKPALKIVQQTRIGNLRDAFKGLYFAVPSIKSAVIKAGVDREFDNPLYNRDDVISYKGFYDFTSAAISAVAPNLKIEDELLSHISEILRELFTNTHRHARTDYLGNPYSKNFRGVIFNLTRLKSKRLSEIVKSGGGDLALFIGEWRPDSDQTFTALDISVVDSGPGFARRWSQIDKHQLTAEQEKEAVLKCFTKHNSTDTRDSSGSGLTNVLNDLKEMRGWLRLRTGRTLIAKSYFAGLGASAISEKDIKIKDHFMEGVVFNIVIPIASLRGNLDVSV